MTLTNDEVYMNTRWVWLMGGAIDSTYVHMKHDVCRFTDFIRQLVLKTRGEGDGVKFEYDSVSDF